MMMMRSRQLVLFLLGPAVFAACRDNPTGIRGPIDLLEKSSSITKSVLHVGDTASIRFALRNRTRDTVAFPLGGCGPPWIRNGAGERVYPATLPLCALSAEYYRLAPGAEYAQTLQILGGQADPQVLPGVPLNIGKYEAAASLFPSIPVHFEVVQ
jgi:hypothetical protein